MRRFFMLIVLFVLGPGCTPQLDEEPRCRLTAEGWLCEDGGSPPDAATQTDFGRPEDDAQAAERDIGTTPRPDMAQPIPAATSCAELKARGDSGRGVRTVEIDGSEREVFCEQDLEGGGWMLVGRSVAGGTGNFGWNTSTGSLTNDGAPFSLGRPDIPVNELLIGNRGDGKAWGNRVYRVALPNAFIDSCAASACATTVTTVTGTCSSTNMFNQAGRTNKADSFWFRDVDGDNPFGLFPDGWRTFYDDCVGGEINGQQGMIFVR
jgi:hypothetical protein